jgi:hypothetical protein
MTDIEPSIEWNKDSEVERLNKIIGRQNLEIMRLRKNVERLTYAPGGSAGEVGNRKKAPTMKKSKGVGVGASVLGSRVNHNSYEKTLENALPKSQQN